LKILIKELKLDLQQLDTYHKEWLLSENLNSPLLILKGDSHYKIKLPVIWRNKIDNFIKNNVKNLNIEFDVASNGFFDENYIFC